MDLAVGSTLQHYTLERLIGAGGMGVVWAARDAKHSRMVALKIMATPEAAVPGARRRFLREAHATRAVGHPAIVPVIDIVETGDVLMLVMDLLHGETLRARLDREGRLSAEHAAGILVPISEALNVAHDAGIVHRDLKPENIFLQTASSGIRPRLLDFGIARFYEPPADAGHTPITGIGTLLGTLPYMAPEQALSPSDCDHRVDAWALGVILYEALAGCRPIEGSTAPELMRSLLVGGITPLSVLAPDLPSELTDLVASLLSRDLERRSSSRDATRRLARYVGVKT